MEGTEREWRDVALFLLNRNVTDTGDSAEARAEGRVGVGVGVGPWCGSASGLETASCSIPTPTRHLSGGVPRPNIRRGATVPAHVPGVREAVLCMHCPRFGI